MTQELRKLVERLSADRPTILRIDAEQAGEAILALLDRVERAEKDATRYQVLRDDKYQLHEDDISVSDMCFQTYFGTDLDEAVDDLEARFIAMEASK